MAQFRIEPKQWNKANYITILLEDFLFASISRAIRISIAKLGKMLCVPTHAIFLKHFVRMACSGKYRSCGKINDLMMNFNRLSDCF